MSDTALQVTTPTVTPTLLAGSIRRTVLDWRDHWLAETELTLNREVQALFVDLEDLFARSSLSEVIMGIGETSRKRIDEALKLWVGEVQERLLDRAHAELRFSLRSEHLSQEALASLMQNRLVLTETPLLEKLRKASETKDWARIRELVVGPKSDSILLEITASIRGLAASVMKRL